MKASVETVPNRWPRLVVLSHVMPIAVASGQQQRVHHTLIALREHFHVTFVGVASPRDHNFIRPKLHDICDEVELLSTPNRKSASALLHRGLGWLYQRRTGLKYSNYIIGHVGLNPSRMRSLLARRQIDLAFFEYFHAADSAPVFQAKGIPCVLDMHNVLWQSFARQLDARGIAAKAKDNAVGRYRAAEEKSWERFDGLIAISEGERDYVKERLGLCKRLFYAPMGIPLHQWPYCWAPVQPHRLAFYGGLSSSHNAEDARRCYHRIMPTVWAKLPNAELWLVGSNPPPDLRLLAQRDPRVHVTGFVERVGDILKTMAVLLCPFSGTYGFRSRVIEAMALGVPVVATPDAVFGMGLKDETGLFLAETDESLAGLALHLLQDSVFAREHSLLARNQVESSFSFEASYGRLSRELFEFVSEYRRGGTCKATAHKRADPAS